LDYETTRLKVVIWDTQGILSYMRAAKRFNISKHVIERNIKNDDSIVKIIHTHIHTYAHIKKLYILCITFKFFVPTCM